MPEGKPFTSTRHQPTGRGSGGVTKRGFRPGQSGNPGGRPRQDVTELARAHTVDAIQALVAALKRPKEAVPAAVAILNRGWGLPRQEIAATGDGSLALHLIAAQSVSAELLATFNEHRVIDGRAEPNSRPDETIVDFSLYPPPLE